MDDVRPGLDDTVSVRESQGLIYLILEVTSSQGNTTRQANKTRADELKYYDIMIHSIHPLHRELSGQSMDPY